MADAGDDYNPLATRYASGEMRNLFSNRSKYTLWRRLWVALAEAEQELGLGVTAEQTAELRAHIEPIDFEAAAHYESRFGHDVVAHIHAFGDQCPQARPIIHLGATSAFVTDNGDLLQYREALRLLKNRLKGLIRLLSAFALAHADTACVALTHLQPAQVTTIGKRACLWLQDLSLDLVEIERRMEQMAFLGLKGAVGTQTSFLALCRGDSDKVRTLEQRVAEKMGFSQLLTIAGQTYSRKYDCLLAQAVSGIAVSAHKMATDLRLLAARREVEEPFEKEQVGSSAMPHKRNPVLSERVCGLARFALSLTENASYTAATQWLERSLDDSSNRRLYLPQLFLTTEAVLLLLTRIVQGIQINPAMIQRHLEEELPFLALEGLLALAVQKGLDRQEAHERLRTHSQAAADQLRQGKPNDLLDRLAADSFLRFTSEELKGALDPTAHVGLAPHQVREFIRRL